MWHIQYSINREVARSFLHHLKFEVIKNKINYSVDLDMEMDLDTENDNVKNVSFPVKPNVMAESIVTDWLSDYASLQAFEIRSFASQHEHNHEIAQALFTIFNERLKYPDVSNVV